MTDRLLIKMRQKRIRENMSQEQLARIIGVSFTTVSKWESEPTRKPIPLCRARIEAWLENKKEG